jgi:serine/threonine protein kinase
MDNMLRIGEAVLGRYQIDDLLSEGGQASVAKGLDTQTGNEVVIKQLIASPGQNHYKEELARFKRAAQIRICHRNVVDPIDSGQENNNWYMIMPFIEGITLDKYLITQGGKLASDQAVSIITEIAQGIGAIHQKGIVHRDLKPENIIIDHNGDPYILDLGICRNTNEKTITTNAGLLGSLIWMSPEQAANPGSEDYRSDLYSLGGIFYLLLTGVPPVKGNDPASVILSICQTIPPSSRQLDPSVPSNIDYCCMKLLAKQKEQRFQTIDDFIATLNGIIPVAQRNSFCTSCGNQAQPDSKYCSNCGAAIGRTHNIVAKCIACGTQVGESPTCSGCGKAFSHSDHRLSFSTGSLTGIVFRIPEGIYYVGRNELSPRDYHISRKHLSIACSDGSVQVEDSGSANKTYIGSQLADHPILLTANQILCIAGNTATYNHK